MPKKEGPPFPRDKKDDPLVSILKDSLKGPEVKPSGPRDNFYTKRAARATAEARADQGARSREEKKLEKRTAERSEKEAEQQAAEALKKSEAQRLQTIRMRLDLLEKSLSKSNVKDRESIESEAMALEDEVRDIERKLEDPKDLNHIERQKALREAVTKLQEAGRERKGVSVPSQEVPVQKENGVVAPNDAVIPDNSKLEKNLAGAETAPTTDPVKEENVIHLDDRSGEVLNKATDDSVVGYSGEAHYPVPDTVPAEGAVGYAGVANYPVPAPLIERNGGISAVTPESPKDVRSKIERARDAVKKERDAYIEAETNRAAQQTDFYKNHRSWVGRQVMRLRNNEEVGELKNLEKETDQKAATYEKALESSVRSRLTKRLRGEGKDQAYIDTYIEKVLPRYRGLIRYNEIVKPALDHQLEAREAALSNTELAIVSKGMEWARKGNNWLEKKVGKTGARVVRALGTTALLTVPAALAGMFSVPLMLSLAGVGAYNFTRSFIGSTLVAATGWAEAAGEGYERIRGRDAKESAQEKMMTHGRRDSMEGGLKGVRKAHEKIAWRADDRRLALEKSGIKMITSYILGAGFAGGYEMIHHAHEAIASSGGFDSVSHEHPTAKDMEAFAKVGQVNSVVGHQGVTAAQMKEFLNQHPQAPDTNSFGSGIMNFFKRWHLPGTPHDPSELQAFGHHINATITDNGDGADKLFGSLREQLHQQYPDPNASDVPPVVKHILTVKDPNILSREFHFDGSHGSEIMHKGDSFGIDDHGRLFSQAEDQPARILMEEEGGKLVSHPIPESAHHITAHHTEHAKGHTHTAGNSAEEKHGTAPTSSDDEIAKIYAYEKAHNGFPLGTEDPRAIVDGAPSAESAQQSTSPIQPNAVHQSHESTPSTMPGHTTLGEFVADNKESSVPVGVHEVAAVNSAENVSATTLGSSPGHTTLGEFTTAPDNAEHFTNSFGTEVDLSRPLGYEWPIPNSHSVFQYFTGGTPKQALQAALEHLAKHPDQSVYVDEPTIDPLTGVVTHSINEYQMAPDGTPAGHYNLYKPDSATGEHLAPPDPRTAFTARLRS